MKKMKVMDDLFIDLIRDMYYAEKQIIKALPKMIKKASSEELKDAFESHLEETQNHVSRLEDVFEVLSLAPRAKKCHAMDGIIEEGKEIMEMDLEPDALDAGLIVAAQKVEHYEIASYGSIRNFAELLGYDKIASIVQETLDEEGGADHKLTSIAQNINERATEGQEMEMAH